VTDRYLTTLWSKAVRTLKGEYCRNPECSELAQGTHHIIKRRYRVLRYDVKNGIPLCMRCHPIADRSAPWALTLIPREDADYLTQMSVYTLPEWLSINHQTRDEFLEQEADELKRIIREGE